MDITEERQRTDLEKKELLLSLLLLYCSARGDRALFVS